MSEFSEEMKRQARAELVESSAAKVCAIIDDIDGIDSGDLFRVMLRIAGIKGGLVLKPREPDDG